MMSKKLLLAIITGAVVGRVLVASKRQHHDEHDPFVPPDADLEIDAQDEAPDQPTVKWEEAPEAEAQPSP